MSKFSHLLARKVFTCHKFKINQEGRHENHLNGEDADGEDDDDPEEVVDDEDDGDGEGSKEKSGDHREKTHGVANAGSMEYRNIDFCWRVF